jgi:large subunit ribosomal protein L4
MILERPWGQWGGKKLYRQKGTGRPRQGSLRAPQYAGGPGSREPCLGRGAPAETGRDRANTTLLAAVASLRRHARGDRVDHLGRTLRQRLR